MSDQRVLGVVGTFVLDRIVGLPGRSGATEGLGGIAYALAAVASCIPGGWRTLPIARVGRDAIGDVAGFLQGLDPLDPSAIAETSEPNNRVELRYRDASNRTERLTGGVGPWSWDDLRPRVDRCDALLVNFISGHEMSLETARRLRARFTGPIYSDLHSLFLDTADDGTRVPLALEDWHEWVGCFDAVQMNEDELELLRGPMEPDRAVREVIAAGPGLVAQTLGPGGVRCWWTADALERLRGGSDGRSGPVGGPGGPGAVRDERVESSEVPAEEVVQGDPTGCGDVWGAAMFCNLLAGACVESAAAAANRLAAIAARHGGAAGLLERFAEGG